MLFGLSGGVGTGKTLNAIKTIIERDDFAGRPVFYHGIRCLLLDYDVCNSFQGWLYGVYWPANRHNKTLEKRLLQIDKEHRLATLDDFPYLAHHYRKHEPFKLWFSWFKKLASPRRLELFKEALDVLELDEDSVTWEEVKDLDLSWKSFADPEAIQDLPSGSVILVDEVQNIWPSRAAGRAMPPSVQFVTTHRHRGIDLVYISQDFRDVDQVIRRRMQAMIHFEFIGGDYLHRYSHIEGFDPASKADLDKCEKKKVKRDSRFYGVYLSSIKHTQKVAIDPTLKRALIMLSVAAIGLSGSAYYMFNFMYAKSQPIDQESTQVTTASNVTDQVNNSVTVPGQTALTPDQAYLTRFLPRYEVMPFTAPVYDSLTSEPVSYPELVCVVTPGDCSCFTQQGTAYALDPEHCVNVARYGYFDPFMSKDKQGSHRAGNNTRTGKNGTTLNNGGIYQ